MKKIAATLAKNSKSQPAAKFAAIAAIGAFSAILTLAASAAPALAQQPRSIIDEVRIGILAHDVPGLWSGWRIENAHPDFNAEVILSPSISLWGGTVRPAIGGSYNAYGGTSKAYADARWEYQTSIGVFFGLGIGAAVHNGHLDPVSVDHKALGSRVLFHFPAEMGYRFADGQTLSVYFEHDSNGYTRKSNEGLDDLGVRYGIKF